MWGTGISQLSLPSSTINNNINYRLVNTEELINLHHASAWNVIEHIFGVLKHCFRILHLTPKCSHKIQAWITAALCAIHNFIHTHDMDDTLSEPE
jgi:hypothetical protein